jgi:hypothetical protein
MVRFAVLLVAFSACVQSTMAADNVAGLLILTQTVGDQNGQISTGHCRCKDQCEVRRSFFSQGRTVAQCMKKCQQAFAGCTRGEIRSNLRRD